MTDGDEVTGWITVAVMLGMAVTMVVATLVHFGSHPLGLTLMFLVGAGFLWSWLKDQRR